MAWRIIQRPEKVNGQNTEIEFAESLINHIQQNIIDYPETDELSN